MFEWFLDQQPRLFTRRKLRRIHNRRDSHRVFLQLEQLETRVTPTAFVWTNAGANNTWENGANWSGGNGTNYPGSGGSTSDTAEFNSDHVASVTMSNAGLTIATLTINNYTGTITLNQPLSVNTGGSMNSGTIVQGAGSTGYSLTISGGTFTWSGGNINYVAGQATTVGQLTISSGAEMDFTNAGAGVTVHLGDNVTNNGTLKLANTSTVELDNTPTITNTTSGKINITVTDHNGLTIGGTTHVTIQNSGTIEKTTDSAGWYDIFDAVNNKASTSVLQVDSGILSFSAGDPSSGYSVNQSAGVIQISGGAELDAYASGLNQSGGTFRTNGTGTATLDTFTASFNMTGGTLQVGDGTPTIATLAVSGNWSWTSGTVSLVYDESGSAYSKISVTGTITVGAAGTTLTEQFVGTGALPDSFNPITATGTINRVAATNNVTGYTASINGGSYVETKN
jgi:hypothetical protein